MQIITTLLLHTDSITNTLLNVLFNDKVQWPKLRKSCKHPELT